ncbi:MULTISPECIES: phosphate ABC transporter substrate-binding protein PstS [unclassified Streptomyces]|uniref:phosphate ABC transporter substrate-binding protein PstS n=1 Tax=unclassified Streptomyces TaxID=2593676 RepID=UPI002E2BCA6D|nr:phosphate ABC transporter substrate-binding protein PstS [Streptomyces sp. NBC_00223]
MPRRTSAPAAALLAALLALLVTSVFGPGAQPAAADSYVPLSGAGSTWAFNAVDQWRRNVKQYGMEIQYAQTGSSDGRHQFLNGTVDFAVSDIPFQTDPTDGSAPEHPTNGSYAYMPIVAGGTVFMYNLKVNGQRLTNLRLSGENVTKIFTGAITNWADPAIAADNPGLRLPAKKIVPVVRSDGSGSSAQFTLWMSKQHTALWNTYCGKVGRAGACGSTSYYPALPGMISQAGDLGVAGYVAQDYGDGAIGYVNYSYAKNAHFPVAKVLNHAGYYTEPTPANVAVSLIKARINTDKNSPDYLTQDLSGVYTDTDKRNYPLSSYSYMILPLKVQGQFTQAKGTTLAAFSYYFMCQGQQYAPKLGYSPLPINLVQAGFDQIRRIPGAQTQNINVKGCHNPTFSNDGTNTLAKSAPFPQECDKQGAAPCTTGSGGATTGGSGGGSNGGGNSGTNGGSGSGGSGSTGSGSGGSSSGGGTNGGAGGGGSGSGGGTGGGAAGGESGGGAGSGGAGGIDPDTGLPVDASSGGSADGGTGDASGGGNGGNSSQVVLAQPVSVGGPSGWGGTQTLMLLAAVVVLGLVLVPAATSRVLTNRKEGKR